MCPPYTHRARKINERIILFYYGRCGPVAAAGRPEIVGTLSSRTLSGMGWSLSRRNGMRRYRAPSVHAVDRFNSSFYTLRLFFFPSRFVVLFMLSFVHSLSFSDFFYARVPRKQANNLFELFEIFSYSPSPNSFQSR